MTVTTSKIEASLDRVRASVRDPRAGLFGPGSKAWHVGREAGIFLGAGRAALLQAAHPFVAHAVEQHSATRTDPAGRFVRTFENVFPMVFGDLEGAIKCARRVHGVHRKIAGFIEEQVGSFAHGDAYHANQEQALFWVAATLWDTSILVYELLIGPLSPSFKEGYYQESKRFAYLFGIPDEVIPPTWPDFEAYNRRMWSSSEVVVGRSARDLCGFLLTPPRPSLGPFVAWYGTLTAALLPEPIRAGYGLPYGRLEQRVFETSLRALRGPYRLLPSQARYLPAYRDAMRRVSGKPRGAVAGALDRGLREVAEIGLRAATRIKPAA